MLSVRRVVGPSMQPTYSPGTIVLGLKWLRPRTGSVVVATRDGLEIIKRVGKVGEQGFYLLGDNPSESTDSRTYGWFAPGSIKSVIIGSIKR
jgi:phage repressor protein C with HTH and peptisase S24 domain